MLRNRWTVRFETVLKLVFAYGLVACAYETNFQDCTIICGAGGCPEGLVCGQEGLCRPAASEACVLDNDGAGGTITHIHGRTIHAFLASQSGAIFTTPSTRSGVEVLVIGGGGGGGSTRGGGGGGAGGVLHLTDFDLAFLPMAIVVTVGSGGGPAANGDDSSFATLTARGGGAGRPTAVPNGGSGGGASHDTNAGSAGIGTNNQGYRGGLNGFNSGTTFSGAGGGGAGGQGNNGLLSEGGLGGPGIASDISGELVHYGGGGGGGGQDTAGSGLLPGIGGAGGGGNGGINAIGNDGLDGTGGGGGGGGGGPDPNFFNGGRGGSGVVIVSYPTQL